MLEKLTSRWQTDTGGAVETGLGGTRVRVQNAPQLEIRQSDHLGVRTAFVLQRKFIFIQNHRVQTALKPVGDARTLPFRQAAGVLGRHLRSEVNGQVRSRRSEFGRTQTSLHVRVVERQAAVVSS